MKPDNSIRYDGRVCIMKKIILKAQVFFFLIWIACITLLIAPAYGGLEGPVVDAISYYNKAVDAAANQSYDEALALINRSLEIQPDFYLALITKAGILQQKGNYDEAESLLDQAEKTHPDNAYVLTAQASLFIETGRYQEALKAADAAVNKDPTLVEAWVLKGTAHGGLGEFEEEKNASEQALARDPNNPQALSNYQFATGSLMTKSRKTGQDYPETPLSIPTVLAGGLFAVVLRRIWE